MPPKKKVAAKLNLSEDEEILPEDERILRSASEERFIASKCNKKRDVVQKQKPKLSYEG